MSQDIVQNTPSKAMTASLDTLAPLSSKALFWRANYLEKSTFLDHIPLLFWAIEQARPSVIVSLGITDAVPYFAACQAIEKLNIEAICFAVEPESDSNLGTVLEYNKQHFDEFSEIVIEDPRTLAATLGNAEIDLLIVNQPLTQALADEIDSLWLSLLSDSTLILFTQGGDAKVFEKYASRLAKDGDVFTINPAQGVHLVLRGTRHNDRLTRLGRLKPGNPGYLNVRQIFSRIGELHRTTYEGQHAAGMLTKTRKQRDEAVKGLETKTREHDEGVAKVARLSEYLKTATAQIAISRAEAFDDKTLLEAMRKELADAHAKDLSDAVADAERQREDDRANAAQAQIQAQAQTDALAAKLKTLEQEAAGLRSAVTNGQDALAKATSERDAAVAATNQRYTELAKLTDMLEQQQHKHDTRAKDLSDALAAAVADAERQREDDRANAAQAQIQAQAQTDALAVRLEEETRALEDATHQRDSFAQEGDSLRKIAARQKPAVVSNAPAQNDPNKRYLELAILTRTLEEREQQQSEQQTAFASKLEENRQHIQQQTARLSEYQNTLKQQERALATAARDLTQMKALHDTAQLHARMIMQLSSAKDEISAVLHGSRMSKKHRALRSDLDQQTALVTKSGLFDPTWYRETYPDITASRLSPVEHFVQLGAYEARNPGPGFDSVKYHMVDPLIAANKMPALLHYLRHGKEEGRQIFAVKA